MKTRFATPFAFASLVSVTLAFTPVARSDSTENAVIHGTAIAAEDASSFRAHCGICFSGGSSSCLAHSLEFPCHEWAALSGHFDDYYDDDFSHAHIQLQGDQYQWGDGSCFDAHPNECPASFGEGGLHDLAVAFERGKLHEFLRHLDAAPGAWLEYNEGRNAFQILSPGCAGGITNVIVHLELHEALGQEWTTLAEHLASDTPSERL